MEDRELAQKIKQLKAVGPDQEWIGSTKESLLGPEEPGMGWFLTHWRPALTGLALSLALVGGLLGLIRFEQQAPETEEPVMVMEQSPLFELEAPLTGLKDQIVELKGQIAVAERRVRNDEDRQQVLELQQTIAQINSLTDNIERVDQDDVLASLGAEIKQAGREVQEAFIENELLDLQEQKEQDLLNEEEVLELSEIEELYQSGDSEGAFWRLMELIN